MRCTTSVSANEFPKRKSRFDLIVIMVGSYLALFTLLQKVGGCKPVGHAIAFAVLSSCCCGFTPLGASREWDMVFRWRARREVKRAMKSPYVRLGGYDAIAAVADNLLPRLISDERLGRFWAHRSEDGVRREKQLLIDFLCQSAGGPMYYTGRDMKSSHKGMRITEEDWTAFLGHLTATLDAFAVPAPEKETVMAFIQSTKGDIVEAPAPGPLRRRKRDPQRHFSARVRAAVRQPWCFIFSAQARGVAHGSASASTGSAPDPAALHHFDSSPAARPSQRSARSVVAPSIFAPASSRRAQGLVVPGGIFKPRPATSCRTVRPEAGCAG